MKTNRLYIRTFVTYVLIGLIGLIVVPPTMLLAFLPKRLRQDNRFLFFLIDLFYRASLKATLLPLRFHHHAALPDGPTIFVANHQSALDIPVLGSLCGGNPHIWFALEYYAYSPILGFFIRRLFVPVDLSKKIKAARALLHLAELITKTKRHALIFPEGGRFTDGTIHSFYSGFAVMAEKSKHPVVPVYFVNNGRIYPPLSFWLYNYPIEVVIGKPFRRSKDETTREFSSRVRAWFVEENNRWHGDNQVQPENNTSAKKELKEISQETE